MAVFHESFEVECGIRVSFREITGKVKELSAGSGIRNGIVTV